PADSGARWVQVAPSADDTNAAFAPPSANGCTWARGGGSVCGDVQGDGKKINSLNVSRLGFVGNICNYTGHWKVTNSSGATIDSGLSSNGGCTPVSAYFHWKINKSYPSGTKVTLTWFRDGDGRDGAVAFQLK
ncbi:hypothetical protein ACIBTP_42195, partial [Streptomyces avidinii]|uniref:hypothetical protein n=1 Tax=Streptomyces avidinii TaxID=1895 RepID=UPI0037A36ABB